MKHISCNVQLRWYGPDNIRGPALFVIQAAPIEISGHVFGVHFQLNNQTLEWDRSHYVVTDPVSGLSAATEKTKGAAIATATERIARAVTAGTMARLLVESAHHAKNLPVFVRPGSAADRAIWRAEHSMRDTFAETEAAAKKRRARNVPRRRFAGSEDRRSAHSLASRALHAVERDENRGFCTACGGSKGGVEPDAREYRCEACGAFAVYGAEEILIKYGAALSAGGRTA
jgi:hypothetical protein